MDQPLASADRVLLLGLQRAGAARIRDWAAQLTDGFLVGVDSDPAIRTARRELVDLDNALFTAGSRDEIPWREAYFTLILDGEGGVATAEMRRVLRPGGRIYSLES
jgi:hypothetical protein